MTSGTRRGESAGPGACTKQTYGAEFEFIINSKNRPKARARMQFSLGRPFLLVRPFYCCCCCPCKCSSAQEKPIALGTTTTAAAATIRTTIVNWPTPTVRAPWRDCSSWLRTSSLDGLRHLCAQSYQGAILESFDLVAFGRV